MWRSLVSAPALGAGGRGFESRHPDQVRVLFPRVGLGAPIDDEFGSFGRVHRTRASCRPPRLGLGGPDLVTFRGAYVTIEVVACRPLPGPAATCAGKGWTAKGPARRPCGAQRAGTAQYLDPSGELEARPPAAATVRALRAFLRRCSCTCGEHCHQGGAGGHWEANCRARRPQRVPRPRRALGQANPGQS